MLRSDPDIEVVGTARNGDEAVELTRKLDPNVVTMDVEMPRRDGLSALKEIMETMPRPVIMVSTMTSEGAEATLKSMDYGAMDFIPKFEQGRSAINLQVVQQELCTKVKAVVHSRRFVRRHPSAPIVRQQVPSAPPPPPPPSAPAGPVTPVAPRSGTATHDCVSIGVSTGGPPAVQRVLSALPKDFPAYILIAQHMPGTFTGPFAKRLDGVCQINVKEAEDGERPKPGWAYVSPGGKHLLLEGRNTTHYLTISAEPVSALYKPSATVLMESSGRLLGSRVVGVIMTGMGSDGCDGVKVLKQKGGYVIAQNEASCVVYGMPKAVVDAGLADEIVELDKLAETIVASVYK
jgi:two-component system chemotaxis response regulator CheB